jgi:GDP-L-fucose synthase
MIADWRSARVLLTGSGGFLGRAIHTRLRTEVAEVLAPRARELDLRDSEATRAFLGKHRPDAVIHAAAVVGGIGENRAHPGRLFYENAIMGVQLIEAARLSGVKRFVCIGTVCAYPKFTPVPFREEDLWNGYPEETNAPYGLAKKMLLVQLQAYRSEYGFDGIYLLPANLYGPGDNFDPQTSHVIAAMIRKFVEAADGNRPTVELWGDGTPTRDFFYVDDAADAIISAAELYDSSEPLNLGTGRETSIAEVASIVAAAAGFHGRIDWNRALPNGQPRRRIDTTRAEGVLGFRPSTDLGEGIRRTVDWYRQVGKS